MFLGLIELDDTLDVSLLAENTSGQPVNADALPTYRVYGPAGLMTGGTGSVALKDTGTITGVSGASPAVVTSAGHGLTNGTRVTITGVTGSGDITNANTTALVANVTSDTFELAGVNTTGGTWSSGGTWNVSGLYALEVDATAANGYASGQSYQVLVQYAISSTAYADLYSFQVA